jgi:hypothetical protein
MTEAVPALAATGGVPNCSGPRTYNKCVERFQQTPVGWLRLSIQLEKQKCVEL